MDLTIPRVLTWQFVVGAALAAVLVLVLLLTQPGPAVSSVARERNNKRRMTCLRARAWGKRV